MAAANQTAGFLGKFTVLKGAARELWLTFAVKFLVIAAYKVTNMTLALWLSSDLGYSDQKAGALVGTWAISITVVTLLVGSLTDAIGLRKTFFLGVWICLVARCVMVFTTVKWVALAAGLFPLAIGEALAAPVILAAVRKYSTTPQRSISFSLVYWVMNIGFLVGGFLFDWVRRSLGEHGHVDLPLIGSGVTTYRVLFLVSLTIEISVLPVLYFMRKGVEVADDGVRIVPEQSKYPGATMVTSFWLTICDSAKATFNLFAGLLKQQGFYRLLVFLLLISFLKLIFMQIDYVFPKFGIREMGAGPPVGRLSGMNNILIIILVPIVGALTQRFSAYRMVMLGAVISAASVFVMALPTAWFQSTANSFVGRWIGWYLNLTGGAHVNQPDAIHPYYVMITLFMIVCSVGEAFYSPRVYEYAASIAPAGQEASYSALSYIPFLLAKLLATTVGTQLLARYCPEFGPRRSEIMWLVVALMATVAPFGLIALRNIIRVKEVGREN